jgi:hypothetical protein
MYNSRKELEKIRENKKNEIKYRMLLCKKDNENIVADGVIEGSVIQCNFCNIKPEYSMYVILYDQERECFSPYRIDEPLVSYLSLERCLMSGKVVGHISENKYKKFYK